MATVGTLRKKTSDAMRSWSDKGGESEKEWKTARLFDQINPTGETKGARIPQINMPCRETSPCPDSTQVNLTQVMVWVTKVEKILGRLKLLDLVDMLLRGSKATLHNRLHSLQPHVEWFAIRRMEMAHSVSGQPVGRQHKRGNKDHAPQGKTVSGQPTRAFQPRGPPQGLLVDSTHHGETSR